ncbi:hypothetical protein BGW80DRAFT_1276244 [Lactifluus volemus]|nr:hypothetical protein BGW80DRAFT_1276244 [Lactifluus volemus]
MPGCCSTTFYPPLIRRLGLGRRHAIKDTQAHRYVSSTTMCFSIEHTQAHQYVSESSTMTCFSTYLISIGWQNRSTGNMKRIY